MFAAIAAFYIVLWHMWVHYVVLDPYFYLACLPVAVIAYLRWDDRRYERCVAARHGERS